ncbi:MAG: glycosyl transferase family protein [Sphingobium sp.]
MTIVDILLTVIVGLRNELLLFAGIGMLVGGLDDLAIDCVYGIRHFWRKATARRRDPAPISSDLPPSAGRGTLAVFVPAWDESDVIGRMLRGCLKAWATDDVHVFVGVYPNDPETISIVTQIAGETDKLTMVVNPLPGPTTKADCLNGAWRAMLRWEEAVGRRAKAIVLHDAEDVVHDDEIRVLSDAIERHELVQLPVLPIVSAESRWISGHYCDEFAEAHGKSLVVRQALGASVPSAGVGCAMAREVMGRLADDRDGGPFDPDSLTEDYEIGLRIGEMGGSGILLRIRDEKGVLIATKEYFPDTIDASVRQKARWTMGIALAGWDRLGWSGGPVETWMRLRDRRALIAAIVLISAYAGMISWTLVELAIVADLGTPAPLPAAMETLMVINFAILLWRAMLRTLFVKRAYGWSEAWRVPIRMVIANIIEMMAARRALFQYVRVWAGEELHWDKTRHRFPDTGTEGAA